MESLLNITDLGKSDQGQQFLELFLRHCDRINFISKDSCQLPPAPQILQMLLNHICPVKLLTLKFVCLEEIFDQHTCHFKLVLPLNQSGNKESSLSLVDESHDTSSECLPLKKLILFGFLSSQNKIASSDGVPIFKTLHLQDSTSQIPCQLSISRCNRLCHLVDKWILVTEANVIYTSKKSGHLELVGEPFSLVRAAILHKPTFDVLLVDDAFLLQYNRSKFNVTNISVTGTVSAVSEIGKIKHDFVFFIELVKDNYSIVILVKNLYLHWQQLVCVGESYVFSSLRPTTLVTAMDSPTAVYVPTKKCQLYITNDCQPSVCLLKEILLENLQSEKSVKLKNPTCTRHSDAISHVGEITSYAADGVIILEGSIRLYLLYNMAFITYKHFRVGTVLQVFNVHRKHSAKENQVRLYCCARSCIKVLKFTNKISRVLPTKICIPTVRFLLKHNLKPTEIDTIQSMEAQFNRISQALFIKSSEQYDFAWKRILANVLKTRKCIKSRKFVQEFIEYIHCCPATAVEDISCRQLQAINVPTFVPLNLRKEFEELAQGILADFEIEKNKSSSSLLSSWRFRRRRFTDKMLVGYLSLNPDTGHLCFTDQCHSINAVCQFWTFNQISHHHRCSGNCIIKRDGETFNFSCPYLHTWCMGKLIALDCFQLVLEVFINNSTGESETNLSLLDSSKFRPVKYLQFSLQDAVIMENITQMSFQYWREISNRTNQLQTSFSGCDLCTCQVYLMTYKESLMKNLFQKGKVPSLQFMTNGYFLGKPFDLPAHCIFEAATKHPYINDSKSTEVKESCSLEDKIPESLSDAVHYQQTIVSFQDDASKWYAAMQTEGSCYLLISYGINPSSTMSAVFKSVYPLVVNKSVQKSHVCLSENILVQELALTHLDSVYEAKLNWLPELLKNPSLQYGTTEETHLYTVSDILCCGMTDTIVNLLPVVVLTYVECNADDKFSRNRSESVIENSQCDTEKSNTTLDFSSFVNKKFRMTVKDILTTCDVNIYLNFKNVSYCLGLLPGAMVEFHHLQRKISKKGNVYCQFIAISTVRVLAGGISGSLDPISGCSFNEMALMKGDKTTLIQDYCTFSFLLRNPKRSHPFWNLVFLAQVLNLSIKTTCTECGSISCKNHCTNMSCRNTAYQLTVRSKLLLDDGSCIAYGFVWHSELLQKILGLSSEEWNDLIHAIHTCSGDIFLQSKNYNEGRMLFESNDNSSCLEQFLKSLCFSPVVKKEWWMVLVKKKIDCKDFSQERRIGFVDGIINTQCMPFQYMTIESVCTEPPFDIGSKMSELSHSVVK